MDRPRTPRRTIPSEHTTLQEITRRYYACAVQLAKAMGLPLTETFLQAHRESISCCFIESGRAGVRLPTGVQLPPLQMSPDDNHLAAGDNATPLPPGAGEVVDINAICTDPLMALVTDSPDQAPPPSTIPVDVGLPCGGQVISALKPAQLAMLVSKVARRVHDEGECWIPLLGALQAERAQRLARGQRRDREGVRRQG